MINTEEVIAAILLLSHWLVDAFMKIQKGINWIDKILCKIGIKADSEIYISATSSTMYPHVHFQAF